MLLKINPNNPEPTKITRVVEGLKNGEVIAYPTDTVYGLGCDIFNKKAVTRIYQIKQRNKKTPLSVLCSDFKQASKYAIIPDYVFKLIKKNLPGPYTFVLKARSNMPKTILSKNKTVGIRIPDNQICLELAARLGSPIITTSLNISGQEVITDLNDLDLEFKNKIDILIDSGPLTNEASTIIDFSQDQPQLIREGKGSLAPFNL